MKTSTSPVVPLIAAAQELIEHALFLGLTDERFRKCWATDQATAEYSSKWLNKRTRSAWRAWREKGYAIDAACVRLGEKAGYLPAGWRRLDALDALLIDAKQLRLSCKQFEDLAGRHPTERGLWMEWHFTRRDARMAERRARFERIAAAMQATRGPHQAWRPLNGVFA
jgi:hypothetical protein